MSDEKKENELSQLHCTVKGALTVALAPAVIIKLNH